jgi:SAM-dependent methyltransferase
LAALMPRAVLHGFDPSEQSLAMIPEAVRARGRFAPRLDDLDRDYGVVVVANVLHHIPPPERQASIAALAARLAPGGQVVVFEHNPWNPATRYVVATCDLDDDAILLRRRETTGLLRGAGLSVVRHDYLTFFPRALTLLRALEPSLGWLPAGAQYAVVARASS